MVQVYLGFVGVVLSTVLEECCVGVLVVTLEVWYETR